MKFVYLLGSYLSALTPYIFIIACGYFFGRVKLITKEDLNSFAKMVNEIFLPVYLFIHVARCTYTLNFELYNSFIISFLFYLVIAGILSFTWAWLSKMDQRYRYTFICMTSFVDIRRLQYLYIDSFCHFLTIKSDAERAYCSNLNCTSEVHTFFQGILIWYVAFNLIRVDKSLALHSDEEWSKVIKDASNTEQNLVESKENKETEIHINQEVELINQSPLSDEGKNKFKGIHNEYKVTNPNDDNILKLNQNNNNDSNDNNNNRIDNNPNNNILTSNPQNSINHQMIQVEEQQRFNNELNEYSKARFRKHNNLWKEIAYIAFRPPIIALFIGFIVGFIRPIRIWLFDTTTPMLVKIFLFIVIIISYSLIPSITLGTPMF